jgi:ribose transport system substrate-binding protein
MKRLCIVIAAVALIAAACGGSSTGPKRLRFALIPKALDIPVFNYANEGAQRQAKALGDVDVTYLGPDHADGLRQKEMLESFISQKVDGIAISVSDADFLTSTIDKAVDAGIPVVTWDSDAPRSKRFAFYGVDDFKSGQIMGEETARLLGGKGTVAFITSLGANNLQRRLDGAKDSLAKYPGITIIDTYDIKEDGVRCAEIIASGTNRYPDLGAWISVGGWPVFTANALTPVNPAKTKFVSFDTNPPAPDLLYDRIHGKTPAAPIIDSGVDVVTTANVDQYVAQWKKMESGG